MKGKARSSKLKLGLPTLFVLCYLFLFAGLLVSTLLYQDLGGVPPRSRMLEESVEKEYDALGHGKTGDVFVGSIPFQMCFN
ncbi:hypothetical protein L6164_035753 [Bauhinia variegata]|uniref:Uncharacterized protein n=1 Tax=Bauhinia variegata TaxID=167791 RepID=A0ACB9KF37_BAUVA|nr:hypothetical protein L6164_035753 [Bauhinia variegata]